MWGLQEKEGILGPVDFQPGLVSSNKDVPKASCSACGFDSVFGLFHVVADVEKDGFRWIATVS